jgi:hypothetical protein
MAECQEKGQVIRIWYGDIGGISETRSFIQFFGVSWEGLFTL